MTQDQFQQCVITKLEKLDQLSEDVAIIKAQLTERQTLTNSVRNWILVIIAALGVAGSWLFAIFK